METADEEGITVLHVDDDPRIRDLVATFLESGTDDVSVRSEGDPLVAIDDLDGVDCVVSDYVMPGIDGLSFLEAVRSREPDLPFLLLTGEGDEEIAATAARLGVSDYLRKPAGPEEYADLEAAVRTAVESHEVDRKRREDERRFSALLEHSTDLVAIVDESGNVAYQSPSVSRVLGYTEAELDDVGAQELVHYEDLPRLVEHVSPLVEQPGASSSPISFRVRHRDGSWRWLEVTVSNRTYDAAIEGFVVNARDVTGRRQREEDLRLRSAALEAAVDGIALVDETGIVEYANEAYVELYGYHDADALVGEPWTAPFEHTGAERLGDQAFPRALHDGYWRGETLARHADDAVVAVEVSLTRLPDYGVVCIARDVTERRERDETMTALYDASLAIGDASSTDELVTLVVEVAESILDCEVSGLWLADGDGPLRSTRVADDGMLTADPLVRSVFESGATRSRTVLDGRDAGAFPEYADEVDREWDADADPERDERRSSDDAGDGDDPWADGERTVDHPSPGGDRSGGWATNGAGTPWGTDGGAVAREVIVPLGNYGVMAVRPTEGRSLDDDQIRFVELLAATTAAAFGRVRREEDLVESRRELERQNEHLDEFAAVVSHDLRNPLTVAQGNLYLYRERGGEDELANVDEALDRMTTLIEDVLTLAREGRTVDDPERVDFARAARSAWEAVESGDVDVELDGWGTILADPGRLEQLFGNLYRNALQHGDGVTTVRVSVTDDGFAVGDDGAGIPEDARETVFESGYSTGDSSGFGLSIVERIAAAHGWTVSLGESDAGGARFVFGNVAFPEQHDTTVDG